MRFKLSEREGLSNLRIPITNMIVATTKLPSKTELRIELVRLDLPVHIKLAVKTATLHRLQQQLLVFLADILDVHPSQGTQVYPYVMMNGYFVIEEAECTRENGSRFLVGNKNPDFNLDEMKEEIDPCVNRLLERDDLVTAAYLPSLKVTEDEDHVSYVLNAPHDHPLLGVAVWLACCL
jgi:hypothetical protein